jgi:hypothetical protein
LHKKLDLFVNYTTKGRLKSTYLDKDDSPVYFVIDKTHLQTVNIPITLIPISKDRFKVILPENFSVNNLYDYKVKVINEFWDNARK